MNEEIEYAEMLEIPVSTVNVIRKSRRKKKSQAQAPCTNNPSPTQTEIPQSADLKHSVIAQVNDKIESDDLPETQIHEPNLEGRLDFDAIPERIDTVRLYSTGEEPNFKNELFGEDYSLTGEKENEGGRYEMNRKKRLSRGMEIAFKVEFAAACVLCGAIFLTNVFVPKSAVNTFFRALVDTPVAEAVDSRAYNDFTLSPVVSDMSDAELALSATGLLTFTDDCCVYPTADGEVLSVTQNENGTYCVRLEHSTSFTETIDGLNFVYYAEGDEVKANVPVGYSDGQQEVAVSLYTGGVLLNCFELTEGNGLTWTTTEVQ